MTAMRAVALPGVQGLGGGPGGDGRGHGQGAGQPKVRVLELRRGHSHAAGDEVAAHEIAGLVWRSRFFGHKLFFSRPSLWFPGEPF